MDIVIVCHTEFGFVHNQKIIFDKKNQRGVKDGVLNLVEIGKKYGSKFTFAVCPEVVDLFPRNIEHEIGLHLHPGFKEYSRRGFEFFIGDSYIKNHCQQTINSSVLRDFSYNEQLEMVRVGKEYIAEKLGVNPTSFVAGRWSLNNDTIRALINNGFTHDCSATAHAKPSHHDWSELPRICMPYRPNCNNYQKSGDLPLLLVPISQFFPRGNVNIESIDLYGLSWLKACFLEYYKQGAPLFHICLHSPSMEDEYFITAMDNLLSFISKHKNIDFKFVSEVKEYPEKKLKTNIFPYILGVNKNLIKTYWQKIIR